MLMSLRVRGALTIALSIQFVALGSIGLELLGLHIPILRQTVWFIYLTFVPGILIITILKMKLSVIKAILYSVGLSISFLMFTGLGINFLLPIIGVRPISEGSIVIIINILISFLLLMCYLRNRGFLDRSVSTKPFDINTVFSLSRCFYLYIVFLPIFGCYLLNFFNNNSILLFFLILISVIPLLIMTGKVPREDYSFLIWIISIALLLRASLTSMFFVRTDAYSEYYFANLVIRNNLWDSTLPISVNSALSIVMLIPIYSIGCGIDPTWYIKAIYPVIFSFTPLGLYFIYKDQTNEKIAFLSTFFFMSIPAFLDWISLNSRQGIAELFLVLLILLMLDKGINGVRKTFLSLIFAFSIIVSHYGLSYIFMFLLATTLTLFFLSGKLTKLYNEPVGIMNPTFVILYVVGTLSWYMYTSDSKGFSIIPNFAMHVVTEFNKFLSPESSSAISIMTQELPFSLEILKVLIIVSIFFTFIGLADSLFKLRRGETFSLGYYLFSIVSYLMIFTSILPHVSISLNVGRIFHISSIFYSPFCVIGAVKLPQYIVKVLKYRSKRVSMKIYEGKRVSSFFLSLFLCCFFLFSSGFISVALTKDYPHPLLVTPAKVQDYVKDGKIEMWKTHVYNCYVTERDVSGAQWLSKNRKVKAKVWADLQSCWMPLSAYGMLGPPAEGAWWQYAVTHVLTNETKIDEGYIYLRGLNVNEGILSPSGHSEDWFSVSDISYVLNNSNKTYTNGYSELYYR